MSHKAVTKLTLERREDFEKYLEIQGQSKDNYLWEAVAGEGIEESKSWPIGLSPL